MPKRYDTYSKWEKDNILEDKLSLVKELVSKGITQNEIAKVLGITAKSVIELKKKHPKFSEAFLHGNEKLKEDLINAIAKRALGYESEEVTTVIEETKNGQKKKIMKSKKVVPPDMNAARYLLIIKFGRDYNDKKDMIDLMEKKTDKEDEWK